MWLLLYHGQLKYMCIILYHLGNQLLEINNFSREIYEKLFVHHWNVWYFYSFSNSGCICMKIWEGNQNLKCLPQGYPSFQLSDKDVTEVGLGPGRQQPCNGNIIKLKIGSNRVEFLLSVNFDNLHHRAIMRN